MALSISFDDARDSQLDVAAPILDAHGVRASFFVLPARVWRRPDEWRRLIRSGHEIGNHTGTHPCSGNFAFSTSNALEDYTLERMEREIDRASRRIENLLDVRPTTFAYPCGQSFVGRGETRTSYVPLVARRFLAGRGYNAETANDPARCDLAHLDAFTVDGLDADALVGLVTDERVDGRWVVLAGHDVGERSEQTVLADALEALCRATDGADIWVAPIGEIAAHVRRVQTAAT